MNHREPAADAAAAASPPLPGSAYPAEPATPIHQPASAAPRRRLGAGAIAAIAAAGALALALVFGGGMATAWAIGPLGGGLGTSFTGDGPGQPPQVGPGGPTEDESWPGERRPETDSGTSDTGTGT